MYPDEETAGTANCRFTSVGSGLKEVPLGTAALSWLLEQPGAEGFSGIYDIPTV